MKPLALRASALASHGFDQQVGGVVLRARSVASDGPITNDDAALVNSRADASVASERGYRSVIVFEDNALEPNDLQDFARTAHFSKSLSYVGDGDVIGFNPRIGHAHVLYRKSAKHNSFLVTERCNHYCLMCSQPPKRADDSWIFDEIAAALPLVDPNVESLGFTGGEPLLQWERFLPLLAQARDTLPRTALHVLSNGRAFADPVVTEAWAALRHPNICVGIPIYAASDHLHDYIVQAKGAFDETILGILRLKDKSQKIEVRIVLHKLTIPMLVETSKWIARNLPFVDHVALMGLENTGFALANQDALWIDPEDYRTELALAVGVLASAHITTSIYNIPLCLVEKSVWQYAVQSISDWKNAYLPACSECSIQPRCAGFFSSGRLRTSRGIQPVHV